MISIQFGCDITSIGLDHREQREWETLIVLMSSMSVPWWRLQMETFSALLAICAGNSPVPGEFPAQRPVTRSFDVFFDLHLNRRLSKQSWGWWFETLSCPLWRHSNVQNVIEKKECGDSGRNNIYRGEAMYISLIDFQWYCTKRNNI